MRAARPELALSERTDTRVEGPARVYARRSACAAVLALSACRLIRHRPSPGPGLRARRSSFSASSSSTRCAAGHRLETARFGGISGLMLDPSTGELLGVCDEGAPNRVFVFRPDLAARPFRVDLKSYFPLPLGPGAPERLDPEGLAMTRAGRLFVASEGFGRVEPRVPPAIVEFTRRADYVGRLAVPSKFIPPATGPLTHGVRANEAFESLTLTPDDQRLFTGTETALVQDGEPADAQHGTVARILEYQASGGSFEPRREFGYPVDPMPATTLHAGISSSAASSSCWPSTRPSCCPWNARTPRNPAASAATLNRIRIFHTSLAGATDVSSLRFAARTARRDARAEDARAGPCGRPRAVPGAPGPRELRRHGIRPAAARRQPHGSARQRRQLQPAPADHLPAVPADESDSESFQLPASSSRSSNVSACPPTVRQSLMQPAADAVCLRGRSRNWELEAGSWKLEAGS